MEEELTKYEKLEVVMYAMTLTERADKRDLWLNKGAFARVHSRGPRALFDYWKARLDSDPLVEDLLNTTWARFVAETENPPATAKSISVQPNKVSALTKAKTLLQAVKNFTASGFVFASDEVYNQRLAICKSCEFWDAASFVNTGSCTLCGCSTKAKLKLPLEKCPADKWLPVSVQEHQ
jgi:hypothetical protein